MRRLVGLLVIVGCGTDPASTTSPATPPTLALPTPPTPAPTQLMDASVPDAAVAGAIQIVPPVGGQYITVSRGDPLWIRLVAQVPGRQSREVTISGLEYLPGAGPPIALTITSVNVGSARFEAGAPVVLPSGSTEFQIAYSGLLPDTKPSYRFRLQITDRNQPLLIETEVVRMRREPVR